MKLFITLKIPRIVAARMRKVKKRFDPASFKRIESHITVQQPFILRSNFKDLAEGLRKTLRGFRSFPMCIRGVGSFGDEVIFFKPNAPRELKRLNEIVVRFIDRRFGLTKGEKRWELKNYHPHSTIAFRMDSDTIRKYKKMLRNNKFKADFIVDGVEIYSWQVDRWEFKSKIIFSR